MPQLGYRSGVDVICPVCETLTYRFPSQVKKGYKNYCSKKCWYSVLPERLASDEAYRSGVLKGLKNGSVKRKQILQSVEYRRKASKLFKRYAKEGRLTPRYGADNNFWKGGVATLQNKLRQTPAYKEWRKAVYKRDNYICQHCGTGQDLHAHHIKTFSKHPDLRYEIDNGITVCRPCHSKIHGRYLPDISKANKKGVKWEK